MDESSFLISIDFDMKLLTIAKDHLDGDRRLNLIHSEGEQWLIENSEKTFDFIFADTWHGKYLMLDH